MEMITCRSLLIVWHQLKDSRSLNPSNPPDSTLVWCQWRNSKAVHAFFQCNQDLLSRQRQLKKKAPALCSPIQRPLHQNPKFFYSGISGVSFHRNYQLDSPPLKGQCVHQQLVVFTNFHKPSQLPPAPPPKCRHSIPSPRSTTQDTSHHNQGCLD